MKLKYYIVFFLSIGMFFFSCWFVNIAVAKEKSTFVYQEKYHKYEMNIEEPKENNEQLRLMIEEKMNKIKDSFLESIKDSEIQKDLTYFLNIQFQKYIADSFISYVFFIETYTGGAHPNINIESIVYNEETSELISITKLINENPNFLKSVSRNVRGNLLINPKLVNTLMMMEGTSEKEENYKTFAITKSGYIFFFPPYQIAPYSSGSFNVNVPF